MRRLGLGLLWLAFLIGLVGTVYFGLDTIGYLPHQALKPDKVSDLKGSQEDLKSSRTRRYLIEMKTKLEKRIVTYPGSTTKKNNARKAMNRGIDLFAKKKYTEAEKQFKYGMAWFSRNPPKTEPTPTKKPTQRADPTAGPPKVTASPDTIASLDKELNELEARLNAITDPNIDTDEAWLNLDRACNAIRSGNVSNAKYFLTETDILIDNLTP